jgi:hypothetical protein
MRFARLAALFTAVPLLTGTGTVSAQLGTIRLDNWFYYVDSYFDSATVQYRPRIFVPFDFAHGWTFVQRADLPFLYTDALGPANPDGDWKFRAGDFMIEEILNTPEVAPNMRLFGSVRLVFPTGGEFPFGADQWQVAPAVGLIYSRPDLWRGTTFFPLARYFFGFDTQSPGVTEIRRLDLFPTVTLGLAPAWALHLYSENPISYNEQTNKWFVPIDALVTHRVSKSFEYGVGGAVAIVDDDRAYRWLVQARLTFYF